MPVPSSSESTELAVKRQGAKIWSHVRQKWLEETPEEFVRQTYLLILVNEYGFKLKQIVEEEEVTGRGSGHARADFVIWRTVQERTAGRNPLIVVECKSDNVTIRAQDYGQGDNYSRLTGARFFVTHNSRETKYWRVLHDRMPKTLEEIDNIPHADANDRMARTSKMNMIMHGDGHGGVHHHDSFVNVNGIFEGRFDIVLTNPPFGANVEAGDVILESEVAVRDQVRERYIREYGASYEESHRRVEVAKGKPIASLFELPKKNQNEVKTEILFIERCLALLKPGGRLGIVLPEGVFNNSSLAYVREFCEDRAYIRAVVSLPQETFYSSGASVKASLLFLQKFTVEEQKTYTAIKQQAEAERRGVYESEINALRIAVKRPPLKPTDFYPKNSKPTEEESAAAYAAARAANAEQHTILHQFDSVPPSWSSQATALRRQPSRNPSSYLDGRRATSDCYRPPNGSSKSKTG